MNRDSVLAELTAHQDNYISGQELAERLNISRVAIWKHIEALKEQGYDIRAVSGRGYQLVSRGGLVDAQAVQCLLGDAVIGRRIIYLPRVDSTNEAIKRMRLDPGLEEGTVLVAGTQERGKGRMGRHWESPPGGLWFSVYLKPRIPLENIALLSLVFSVAI
ncbi:MAG: biotin operon repressor, partial [Deltaproteobacteria bacterium]